MTLAPGATFAGYAIETVIHRDAANAVYRVTQGGLRRPVALKVFDPVAGDDAFASRFMRELRASASIEHPNVVPVHDAGVEDASPFLALDYVEGSDAGALIRNEGRLEPSRAARIAAQAASALAAAHARGLVHRNLKPPKILIAEAGHVGVIGWGETQRRHEALVLPRAVAYSPPEQLMGERFDVRSDVYALGCVLFELLTGHAPFERDSDISTVFAHLRDPPPSLAQFSPELARFDTVIHRALAKQPDDRPDAREFERLLLDLVGERPEALVTSASSRPGPAATEFEVLDSIVVHHAGEDRRIDLCSGDLTAVPESEVCDVLVVSAIPGSYFPTPHSVIGALARNGVFLEELARQKYVDLRDTCSCWLSRELRGAEAKLGYRKILCFEPANEGSPAEVVGDIFRALVPFLGDGGFRTVAMPVVSAGDAGHPVGQMLTAVIEAAVNWMSMGVSLKRLLIFAPLAPDKRAEARALFTELKRSMTPAAGAHGESWEYDIFLSYAHENGEYAAFMAEELEQARPGLRLFMDRRRLNPGRAWQHEIFEALDASQRVLALYSPEYVRSKVCKEEFNIAWARGRDLDRDVLFPVYLFSAPLPTYMKLVQYTDCREGSRERLASACRTVVTNAA